MTETSDDVAVNSSNYTVNTTLRLTFTAGNWNTPQKVTVRVKSDASPSDVTLSHSVEDVDGRDMSYDTVSSIQSVTVSIKGRSPHRREVEPDFAVDP